MIQNVIGPSQFQLMFYIIKELSFSFHLSSYVKECSVTKPDYLNSSA